MSFAGLLCDLDGVLVDSGDAVERIWRAWAGERGIDPGLVARASHGVPSRAVIARVAPELDPDAEGARVDARHAATGGAALPGAAALLSAPSLPLAVVTSCTAELARARLRAAGLPEPPALVTAEAVARGKPSPDPYLAGAAALGLDARDCLVVEDAPAGVAAGRAAGATVWAVTTTHAAGELDGAERVAADLERLFEALRGSRSPTGRRP
jgi:mannitol-1-/sugar-/sorbitol-6-phosphatase